MTKIKPKEIEVAIYKSRDGITQVEVNLKRDNLWISQEQMARLFEIGRNTVTRHIGNIFRSGELGEKSNVQKTYFTNSDKPVKLYSLDMILSVGYRVNSQKATQFRIWATKVLKEHLLNGYTINEKLLVQQRNKLNEIKNAINFIEEKSHQKLLRKQSQELLFLIRQYTKSIDLLEQYDNKRVKRVRGSKTSYVITYDEARAVISELKKNLQNSRAQIGMFAVETSEKLKGVIGNLNQTFGGVELYKSVEEKAANLLYLVIKDHPFVDGNKRTGSILFIHFLDRNNILFRANGERKINDNALVALALLVAISNPIEKDILIKVIIGLLSD